MKLISEFTETGLECMIEAKKMVVVRTMSSKVSLHKQIKRIETDVFIRDTIMENGSKQVRSEQVSKKRAVGELNHPEGPTVNLDKVSHLITDLRLEGNDVIGKAQILDTPMGKIVKGLLEGGVQLGVSTRGMGSLRTETVSRTLKMTLSLHTVDIVQDPSAPDAFVNGIMEGVDWVWNNGILEPQVIEDMETEIKKAPKAYSSAVQIREFKNFLSLIKSNM